MFGMNCVMLLSNWSNWQARSLEKMIMLNAGRVSSASRGEYGMTENKEVASNKIDPDMSIISATMICSPALKLLIFAEISRLEI